MNWSVSAGVRAAGRPTPQRSTIAGSPHATIDDDGGVDCVRRRSSPSRVSGNALMTCAQVATVAAAESGGAVTVTGGRTAPLDGCVDGPSPDPAPPISRPRTITSGTVTAVAIRAARRTTGSIANSSPGQRSGASEVHDGAGQRAGDARDGLHVRDDELAQLVHRLRLGPDDHVVGPRHILGVRDTGQRPDRLGDRGRLAD